MARREKDNFGLKILLLVSAGILVIAGTAAIIIHNSGEPKKQNDNQQPIQEAPGVSQEIPDGSETEPLCRIESPAGVLTLPAQWNDLVRAECKTDESGFSATIWATGDAPEVPLYTILMGTGITQGQPIGTVQTETGTMEVRIMVNEIEIDDQWDAGEVDTLFAVQESLNDVLEQIMEAPGFKSAN